MAERKRVTCTPLLEYSSFEEPLSEFVERLQSILAAIPVDLRDTAMFEFEGGGHDESGKIFVRYVRPQTDEEVAAERQWHSKYEAERAAEERAQYARLKAKFESK